MNNSNLNFGNPFWPKQDGLLKTYAKLDGDINVEVAIVGAGITGAMIGYHFAKAGINTIIIDKNEPASGSTAASTALLLYELDTHLADLVNLIGLDRAVQAYKVCYDALDELNDVIHETGDHCFYKHKKSLYFASRNEDVKKLEQEYEIRRKNGFNVEFLNSEDIKNKFSFDKPAALLTPDAAEVDPYLLTHQLLDKARGYGLEIFSNTLVDKFEEREGGVILRAGNYKIKAKKVVFATGYESQKFLKKKIVNLYTSFAFASQKFTNLDSWINDYLVWETARPYLYLRTTPDCRIVVGGEDERALTSSDKLIAEKTKKLVNKTGGLLKDIELEPEFSWGGIFGTTKDGLPYIGENKDFKNAYFALCYDANGMVYSVIAANLLLDLYFNRKNKNADLFGFGR